MTAPHHNDLAATEILQGPKFGNGIGFRRVQELLSPLWESEWGRTFDTIRVTGSNGKGSVTALTHSMLRSLGLRVGRFTSPHLYRFNERIVIDDADISDEALREAYRWVKAGVQEIERKYPEDRFGSFELATATCIRSFSLEQVPLAVIEAGIGGRLDTTRLLPGKLVALTSLDLEHTELLGKSLELIGCDKIDLCPDGGHVVSPQRNRDLWTRLAAYCKVRQIELHDSLQMCHVRWLRTSREPQQFGMHVRLKSEMLDDECFIPLVGSHQIENIATSVSLVEHWARQNLPQLSRSEFARRILAGLTNVKWPGRCELISAEPRVIIDVGHSPDACRRLIETLHNGFPAEPFLLVTGVSANKAVEEILRILTPIAPVVICTRAYHNGEAVQRIADCVTSLPGNRTVLSAPTIEDAVQSSRKIAAETGRTVLVAGGLFLAIEFATAWKGEDPQCLAFL